MKRQLRRAVLSAVAVVVAMFGMSIAAAAPAEASTTYHYPVYHYQVCQRQGHFGASYYNPWDPYSWYCYDMSVRLGVTWAGGLDINGWCAATYPGSHAELTGTDVWGWECLKVV